MTILYWLRKNQANRKGECPIWCSISKHPYKAEFSCRCSVHPNEWDQANQQATGKQAEFLNAHLEQIMARLLNIRLQLQAQDKPILPQAIKDIFFAKPEKIIFLKDLLTEHFNEKKLRLKPNSLKNEKSRRQNIIRFLAETEQANIAVEEIDESFMDDLEIFLQYKITTDHNYKIKHLRLVKETLTWAKKRKKIKANPLQDITWINGEDQSTPVLSSYEVHKIESTIFTSESLQHAADRLLIQIYTGFSYIDLVNFKPDTDIVGKWIKKERQKTNIEAIIPVMEKLKLILAKYEGIPPVISNAKYNEQLKSIAKICGIRMKLSSRVARKTAGQLWIDAGVSIESVSKMLGHANIKTTQKAYVKVTEKRIELELKKTGLWE
ncbi:site-specific integrase [Xanthocytophaga agilis]|uniref:Phage integrase SAM-like domain-containing protein n=1 Tax=Xanthocytophaga agilis TaxID=3048010 RepID=A0AAE3RC60_9BACT|nr:phage integrase SAM-like domain-containing protein [Xanthocytophaga agilis]MDJ1504982.1 phage integrase SAM-like domain-containing protein [Xanthocytophaga agilis]